MLLFNMLLGCMQEYVYAYILVYYVCLVASDSDADSSVRSEPVTGDLDLIQIRVHYKPNTLAIRRPTHGMIRMFVPVRTVKTIQRFGSKTASFHVSVFSCIIFLSIISLYIYILLISFHVTV